MTSTVEEVAAALGAALGTANVRYIDYLADTFSPPGTPPGATMAPGIALIDVGEVEFHQSFGGAGGLTLVHWTILLLWVRTNDRAAWLAMQDAISPVSPTSIRAALEVPDATGWTTLGGVVQAAIVRSTSAPKAVVITPPGGTAVPYLNVDFKVDTYV